MSKLFSRAKNKVLDKFFKQFLLKKKVKQGYAAFVANGVTPPDSYLAFIQLYCSTNGKHTEEFQKKLSSLHPPAPASEKISRTLGKLSSADFQNINTTLNKDGYACFEKKLSPEIVDRLNTFALRTPSTTPPTYSSPLIYDPQKPVAEIYRFGMNDLMSNADIQQLIMDPALIHIAREYLGCEPIFDFPAMWWSTSFLKEASSEAAQLYHFDLDRVKWLKIFFYLNDVTPENGPHCYIRGSHLTGSKPPSLLKRGYARIKDSELIPFYKKEDFKAVCASAGSIFAGDTKCWHKGTPLKKGHRLVLELEYTSSLFGTNYPKLSVKNSSEEFKQFCKNNKILASNIIFND